jgi:hypothetical protein
MEIVIAARKRMRRQKSVDGQYITHSDFVSVDKEMFKKVLAGLWDAISLKRVWAAKDWVLLRDRTGSSVCARAQQHISGDSPATIISRPALSDVCN